MKIYPQAQDLWISVKNPGKPTFAGQKAVDNCVESVDLSTFSCIVYTRNENVRCTKNEVNSYNILRKVTFFACLETTLLIY